MRRDDPYITIKKYIKHAYKKDYGIKIYTCTMYLLIFAFLAFGKIQSNHFSMSLLAYILFSIACAILLIRFYRIKKNDYKIFTPKDILVTKTQITDINKKRRACTYKIKTGEEVLVKSPFIKKTLTAECYLVKTKTGQMMLTPTRYKKKMNFKTIAIIFFGIIFAGFMTVRLFNNPDIPTEDIKTQIEETLSSDKKEEKPQIDISIYKDTGNKISGTIKDIYTKWYKEGGYELAYISLLEEPNLTFRIKTPIPYHTGQIVTITFKRPDKNGSALIEEVN